MLKMIMLFSLLISLISSEVFTHSVTGLGDNGGVLSFIFQFDDADTSDGLLNFSDGEINFITSISVNGGFFDGVDFAPNDEDFSSFALQIAGDGPIVVPPPDFTQNLFTPENGGDAIADIVDSSTNFRLRGFPFGSRTLSVDNGVDTEVFDLSSTNVVPEPSFYIILLFVFLFFRLHKYICKISRIKN